ncbi:MAG: bifunctional 2-C-methyl-D-erythritol 4-phosphate cytidylyltransferase/2-C-methyl-D-erythritol 2,4-cyclodiphosphate synthase [Hyphomicrobiaceae bacterium]|nr:bifunctional 2-C-methyl-D-erythritol 4-phosphate cytidylyltransferase/2-C-methyl-D-erythritol 2,4-cyclodiphosphate synthase [Hyphomicrobiaceae bacterium]
MEIAALIVAAGRGTRATGGEGDGPRAPKQYAEIGRRSVLHHAVEAFAGSEAIHSILVVIHADDDEAYSNAIRHLSPAARGKLREPVAGGATRQASVLAGLEGLQRLAAPAGVLIHDAARPWVNTDVIARVAAAVVRGTGAVAALPVADTLKKEGADGTIEATVERQGLWRAQTPQGFPFPAILAAHRRAASAGRTDFTDDAAIAEWAGLPVRLVAGAARNDKITTAEDLAMARLQFGAQGPAMVPLSGIGFDVHRLTEGDHVWLCGVKIAHTHGLLGHSDADVGLHALTDAILGAIGDGDIGQHFPPSDPKWKGAASVRFLADAARRVEARGGRIVNVDVMLMCEAPKVGPHREAMRAVIAETLGLGMARVGVKATTTEGLGFTGRREGIAALATVSLLMPE